MCLNSSELEIMENVLNLDGINKLDKKQYYSDRNLTPANKGQKINFGIYKNEEEIVLAGDAMKNLNKSKSLNLQSFIKNGDVKNENSDKKSVDKIISENDKKLEDQFIGGKDWEGNRENNKYFNENISSDKSQEESEEIKINI